MIKTLVTLREEEASHYLLEERLRLLLPPFFTLDLVVSDFVLVFPLLDLTGLRPRLLEVRFFSLSLRVDGDRDRDRLRRPLKNRMQNKFM